MVGKHRARQRFEHRGSLRLSVYLSAAISPEIRNSRNSTTGLVAKVGEHMLESGSTMQTPTALSVGEAEYCAVDMGSAVALVLRCLHADVRIDIVCQGRKGQFNVRQSLGTYWDESEENKIAQHASRNTGTRAGRRLSCNQGAHDAELSRRGNEGQSLDLHSSNIAKP